MSIGITVTTCGRIFLSARVFSDDHGERIDERELRVNVDGGTVTDCEAIANAVVVGLLPQLGALLARGVR